MEFVKNLKYNTAVFNAFKNHHQSGQLRDLLTDENGRVLPWKEFKELSAPITEKYNQRWLQTEFNCAHQSALMARKWRDFESSKDLYPNLEFVAVMDERTREEHAALNGLIYPMDHSFWDIYYPPIDWNCRCTVRQTDADPEQDIPDELPTIPDALQTNPGKSGQVFSRKHPYYKGVSKTEKADILEFVSNNMDQEEEE